MPLTKEQNNIVEHIVNNDGILLVPAGAGCGKSYLSRIIVDILKPVKGLYTAFNKAIVLDGADRFKGTGVECKTTHSLAYKYVQPHKVGELSYECIVEDIDYPSKAKVLDAINSFYVSDSLDMYDFFDKFLEDSEEKLKGLCASYVDKMINKEIPMSFNFMLKLFHSMLADGLECKYDIVILDEINDVTAVNLEIFKLIQAPKKLGLGETNQAIYQFLKLKDGFSELPEAKQLPLTNSFRCSKKIATGIEDLMQSYVDSDFTFTGTNKPVANGKTLYVTNTNAAIIHLIQEFFSLNKRFTLLRKVSEIFAYPMAIITAGAGKKVYQSQYRFLEKEYRNFRKGKFKMSFMSYLVREVQDDETTSAVALLAELASKKINLFDLYNKAKNMKSDPQYTISTVFTSKGLEFETVYVNDDLNNRITSVIEKGGVETTEDLVAFRCYYVACSRAGKNLINAEHL